VNKNPVIEGEYMPGFGEGAKTAGIEVDLGIPEADPSFREKAGIVSFRQASQPGSSEILASHP
jgi:hypothetical protein